MTATRDVVELLLCHCHRCGHDWIERPGKPYGSVAKPKRCAKCKARTWDQPVARRAGRRPKWEE